MKKNIMYLFFAVSPLFILAQEKDSLQLEDVPFAIIEQAPIYPECETLRKDLHKLCMQNQIKKHIAKNFNMKVVQDLNLDPGKKRVYVQFKIDENGLIKDVVARGPHKEVEKEGIRIVKLLPKMTPGKHKGKNVGVKYTLPITFLVEEIKDKKRKYKF